jgi:hypothetical protein
VVIIRDDDPAFTCGHQFAGLKAERSRASEGSNATAAPLATVRVRTVLDQSELVFGSNFSQAVKVGGMAAHMHRDDCFGPRSDGGFCQIWIDTVGLSPNIDHDRHRSGKQNRAGRRHEGEIRNDDFLSGTDPESCHDDFDCGRAVRDRDAVLGAMILCECVFEIKRASTRRAPPYPAL